MLISKYMKHCVFAGFKDDVRRVLETQGIYIDPGYILNMIVLSLKIG